jgi:hypothetical protein
MNQLKFLGAISFASLSALISACGGGDNGGELDIHFSVVDTDQNSRVREQRFAVIKGGLDWTTLWAEHKGGTQVAPPAIDFSNNMALGVFLGQRTSGCYSVAIRTIVQSANKITVQYKETVPSPATGCTTALVFPSQIATIPALNLPVEFVGVD